jgi:hypothetical protein
MKDQGKKRTKGKDEKDERCTVHKLNGKEHCTLKISKSGENYFGVDIRTGPAAVPGGRSSPRGGGGTPLCIGKQEVGTYIYSHPYTVHGALGRLL